MVEFEDYNEQLFMRSKDRWRRGEAEASPVELRRALPSRFRALPGSETAAEQHQQQPCMLLRAASLAPGDDALGGVAQGTTRPGGGRIMKQERWVLGSLLAISLALVFLCVATYHSNGIDEESQRPFPVVASAKDLALSRRSASPLHPETVVSTAEAKSISQFQKHDISAFISSELQSHSDIAMYTSILGVYNLSMTSATGSSNYELKNINNDEIAIVQFDSRNLNDYWMTSAIWNNYYCARHGHKYIYYTTNNKFCMHGSEELASPWCKVKSMLRCVWLHA